MTAVRSCAIDGLMARFERALEVAAPRGFQVDVQAVQVREVRRDGIFGAGRDCRLAVHGLCRRGEIALFRLHARQHVERSGQHIRVVLGRGELHGLGRIRQRLPEIPP